MGIRSQRAGEDSSCLASSSLSSTEIQAILVLRVPYSHDDCQAMQTARCPWGGGERIYGTEYLYRVSGHGGRRFLDIKGHVH
jgi:hypothetical protein